MARQRLVMMVIAACLCTAAAHAAAADASRLLSRKSTRSSAGLECLRPLATAQSQFIQSHLASDPSWLVQSRLPSDPPAHAPVIRPWFQKAVLALLQWPLDTLEQLMGPMDQLAQCAMRWRMATSSRWLQPSMFWRWHEPAPAARGFVRQAVVPSQRIDRHAFALPLSIIAFPRNIRPRARCAGWRYDGQRLAWLQLRGPPSRRSKLHANHLIHFATSRPDRILRLISHDRRGALVGRFCAVKIFNRFCVFLSL